jgi:hypothetical protein
MSELAGWERNAVTVSLRHHHKRKTGMNRSRQQTAHEEINQRKMKHVIDTQWVNHSHPRKVGSHLEANIA